MRKEASVNWRGSIETPGQQDSGEVQDLGEAQSQSQEDSRGQDGTKEQDQCCVQGNLERLCLESVWLRPRVSGLQLQLFWGALETETVSGLFGDRFFLLLLLLGAFQGIEMRRVFVYLFFSLSI